MARILKFTLPFIFVFGVVLSTARPARATNCASIYPFVESPLGYASHKWNDQNTAVVVWIYNGQCNDIYHIWVTTGNSSIQVDAGGGNCSNIPPLTHDYPGCAWYVPIEASKTYTFNIQGCQTHTFGSDDCTSWSPTYTLTPTPPRPPPVPPPAPPPAPAPAPSPASLLAPIRANAAFGPSNQVNVTWSTDPKSSAADWFEVEHRVGIAPKLDAGASTWTIVSGRLPQSARSFMGGSFPSLSNLHHIFRVCSGDPNSRQCSTPVEEKMGPICVNCGKGKLIVSP
jgi:hypothetical protein